MDRHFTGLKKVLRSSVGVGATCPDRLATPRLSTSERTTVLDIDKRDYQLESADDHNSTGIPLARGSRGRDGRRGSWLDIGDVSARPVHAAISGFGHSLCVMD